MRKFISCLLTLVMLCTIGTKSVFSENTYKKLCVVDEHNYYVENDWYNYVDQSIYLPAGGKSNYVVLYYVGSCEDCRDSIKANYTNVTKDVTILDNNTYFNAEIITSDVFGNGGALVGENQDLLFISSLNKGDSGRLNYTPQGEESVSLDINVFYSDLYATQTIGDITKYYSNLNEVKEGEEFALDFYVKVDVDAYSKVTDLTKLTISDPTKCHFDNNGKLILDKSGFVKISYNTGNKDGDQNDIIYEFNIDIRNEDSKFEFEYGGKKYIIGIGNGSTDGGTMHIDDSCMIQLINDGRHFFGFGGDLLIGELGKNGQIVGAAPKEVYSLFSNIDFKLEGNDIAGISMKIEDVKRFGANTKSANCDVNRTESTTCKLVTTFDVDLGTGVEHKRIAYGVSVEKIISKEIKPDTLSFTDLKTALSSNEELLDFVQGVLNDDSYQLGQNDQITISIPEGSYSGKIEINLDGDEFYKLILDGEGKVTINGGIKNESGLSEIRGIKFVANDNNKFNYDGADYNIGIIVDDTTNERPKADLSRVDNCTFTGYDYGILSKGNSLVSGIQNCKFNDCKVGIYENSFTNEDYSDSLYNVFNGCDVGIEILRVPVNSNPYQFVFRENEFYNADNTSCDYKIHCEGNFFYTKNYYGKDGNVGMDTSNNRTARIKYEDNAVDNTVVYTNPCVRYPNANARLGIDPTPGLYTGIVFTDSHDTSNRLNEADFLNSGISLDLCKAGNGMQLGKINFKGAH